VVGRRNRVSSTNISENPQDWVPVCGSNSERNRVSFLNLGEDAKVRAETRFLVPVRKVGSNRNRGVRLRKGLGRSPAFLRGHYEIVPREANLLTYEQYQDELNKIKAVLEE
jgi:hypothetical protein